jgi:DNA polymerase (family 10)
MENKTIARNLRLLSQLMELHNENPFKIKSVANAAFKVDKLPYAVQGKSLEEIAQIDGLGKSISSKVWELLETGTMTDLTAILAETPEGIVEMLGIKGIGPKKIGVIWTDLGIESIGELYYACNENRLIEAKGFGLKTQEEIKKIIEFRMAGQGKFLYAHAESSVNTLYSELAVWLNTISGEPLLGIAGEYRRCMEIIEGVPFLIGADQVVEVQEKIASFEAIAFEEQADGSYAATSISGLKVQLHLVQKEDFYLNWFKLTGNEQHVNEVLALAGSGPFEDEAAIYHGGGLVLVARVLRD